jgi:hypothetical protein
MRGRMGRIRKFFLVPNALTTKDTKVHEGCTFPVPSWTFVAFVVMDFEIVT